MCTSVWTDRRLRGSGGFGAEGIQNLPWCGGGCAQAQALALLCGLRAHPATNAHQLTSTGAA